MGILILIQDGEMAGGQTGRFGNPCWISRDGYD